MIKGKTVLAVHGASVPMVHFARRFMVPSTRSYVM